jgi:hypothetical protein
MKKFAVIVAACALAACGQPAAPPEPVNQTAPTAIPTGSFNAYGDAPEFEFIADTSAQAIELRMNYETVASAPYSPPQPNGEGARIISGELTVDLVPGDCTASGVRYPLRITIQPVGREAVSGCAIERWDTRLLELMPYIDACIAKSPETRWVTYAGDTGEALITVRLQSGASSVDCTIPSDDPDNAQVSQRREDLRIAGEGAAIFVRGPGENPGGECYDAPEVRAANGEMLGWMMDPMGC